MSRSPNKERFFQAFKHIESPEISPAEFDPDMTLVNQIMGKEFAYSLHAYELPVADNLELNLRMGNDLLYFSQIWRLH